MRALVYTRVSADRAGGRSPEEQESESRRVCEREGWDVERVLTDSIGASRHSRGERTDWAEAKRMIAARECDVLVTFAASRAQRDLTAYAELRDLCASSEVLWSYSGRTYDLNDPDDRYRTGNDALNAERESDEISRNVKRALRANAEKGRPHGKRLFGYQRMYEPTSGLLLGQEPHPEEATVVRRVFHEYLAGMSIRSLVTSLNEEGITTSTGGRWDRGNIRRVLTNVSYAGLRSHRGTITPATWPALIDLAEFERVQARLESKRGTKQTPTARLLTGVGRCGVCGGRIHALRDYTGREVYNCAAKFCVGRDLDSTDAYVTSVVLGFLRERRPAAPADPVISDAEASMGELRRRLEEATVEFSAGRLTASTLARIEQDLLPQINAAKRAVSKARAQVPMVVEHGDDLAGWWDDLTAEKRREVVGAVLSAVVLLPVGRGKGRTFDPSKVTVEFR